MGSTSATMTLTLLSPNESLITLSVAWNHSAGSSITSPFVRAVPALKRVVVTTSNYPLIVKYVPDWMPGAHFKQVAKEARAVFKRFLDEPLMEVEKRVVSILIAVLHSCTYFV